MPTTLTTLERPSLPASSSEFDLPVLNRTSSDGLSPFMLHLEKPSLLNPKLNHLSSDKRHRSPLTTSFTRRRLSSSNGEESESDRDSRMWTSDRSSSSSSGNATPPQPEGSGASDVDAQMKALGAPAPIPSTPPRRPSLTSVEMMDSHPYRRRLSIARTQPKPPRILSLKAESRPEECELKSEAQFQRLVASYSDNPLFPKTPRAPSDRGRYPEEAGEEEFQREDTPSDDGEDSTFAFNAPDPILISRRGTPVHNFDDTYNMGSPGGYASMDIDSFGFGSPTVSSGSWRYTPPPTSSAVRSNKRKHDERYDPYPAAKRRAVSPSVYFRGPPRVSMPIAIPIQIPGSTASSTCSSPVVTQLPSYYHQQNYAFSRSGVGSPMASSPTMRANMGLAASPILRPLPRARREGDEREVDNAGDGVGSINLE